MNDIIEAGAPTGGTGPLTEEPGASQPLAKDSGASQPLAEDSGASQPLAEEPSGVRPLAEPGGSQPLAADLLTAISAIRRVTRRAVRSAWHAEPLPPTQSELLRLAAARPGIAVADAARELRLAPNTVSTLVGRLTAAGLLDRARAESDGRSVRLTVTAKAERRIAEWRDLRAELAARALDRLAADDRKTLADAVPALLRFAAQLEEKP